MEDFVYRGSFRYADRAALDRALNDAHEQLDDDEVTDHDRRWMRHLTSVGMTVRIAACLPAIADRHVAAAILGALARGAIEGHVDVMCGNALLDAFVPEPRLSSGRHG